MKLPIAIVIILIALVGCASLQNGSFIARVAVQDATLRFIDESEAKKVEVRATAEKAKALIGDESATVSVVAEAIRATIPWDDLSLADRRLLTLLLQELEIELQVRVGKGELNPDDRVAVLNVLEWIVRATYL